MFPFRKTFIPFVLVNAFLLLAMLSAASFAATDPGVRGGLAGAGKPLPGLTPDETSFFNAGLARFIQVDAVQNGLGPRFNMDSCSGCHAQPAVGGTSPFSNPQVTVANKNGASNVVPFFVLSDGPVREARFIYNPDGTRDGGVHALYTISG